MSEGRTALQRMMDTRQLQSLITGKVKHVDAETCDVDPSDGGATIFSVRLKPAVNGVVKGAIQYPEVGSTCVIGMLNKDRNNWLLLYAERIDRMLVKMDDGAQLELKANGVVELNGSNYGGVVKVNELVSDLNKFKTAFANLKAAFNSWVPVPNDGGAALKSQLSAVFMNSPLPDLNQLASDKTKHGSL